MLLRVDSELMRPLLDMVAKNLSCVLWLWPSSRTFHWHPRSPPSMLTYPPSNANGDFNQVTTGMFVIGVWSYGLKPAKRLGAVQDARRRFSENSSSYLVSQD